MTPHPAHRNGRHVPPPEVAAAVAGALAEHGAAPDALIPVLARVCRVLGHLSPAALAETARQMGVPLSQVHAVATFYTMLPTTPRGRHTVQFCENAPCHVAGGWAVWRALRDALGLAPGQTSPDGRFTLLTTSCIGQCAAGPVVVVDDEAHGPLAPDDIPALLARYP